jgi:hypothetical protein
MAVVGIDKFRQHFAGEEQRYALIGGAACSLIFEEVGLEFRATKDLDMVLCVEVVDGGFGEKLAKFLDEGGYQARQRGTGTREFFRFHQPTDKSYPAMLELFARHPGALELPETVHLSPIDVATEALSLSAILLDQDYYDALLASKRVVDGISVLDETLLIPFKAKAFVDLRANEGKGDDIKKHRLDVVRLTQLLAPDVLIEVSEKLKSDLVAYIAAVEQDGGLDPSSIGIRSSWEEIVDILRTSYGLGPVPVSTMGPL